MNAQESNEIWGAVTTMAITLIPILTAYLAFVLHNAMTETAKKVEAQNNLTQKNHEALATAVEKLNTLLTTAVPTNADLSKQISDSTATLKQNGAKP